MNWLSALFGGSDIVGGIAKIADDFNFSGEEKAELNLRMQAMIIERENKIQAAIMTELGAKERIIVAEMSQKDNFTKRARPTVVYAGLVFIAINHVIAPWASHFAGIEVPLIEMPTEFWVAWGGIVETWSVGRSMEKMGGSNKIAGKNSIIGVLTK